MKDTLIRYPNGIALGPNHQMYIATYDHGLVRFDFIKKQLSQLPGFKDSVMNYNLDGLAYTSHSLFGVYNGDSTNKNNAVVQYILDPSGTKIIEERIIDKGNVHFHEPTTLAVANKHIYVLANSHLEAYNKNRQSVSGIENKLIPPVIILYSEEQGGFD